MTETGQLWLGAAVFFALFLALGLVVMRWPIIRLDGIAARFRGHGTRIAWVFTLSGYGSTIVVLAIICATLSLATHAFTWQTAFLFASQTVSQALVNVAKMIFGRVRPEQWLLRKERGFSFPSGHACTAIALYGTAAALVWGTDWHPAVRALGGGALLVWALGVAWSRMTLAAHFFTDVLGGLLFGLSWTLFGLAVASRFGIVLR